MNERNTMAYAGLLFSAFSFGLFGVLIYHVSLMFGDVFQVVMRNVVAVVVVAAIIVYKRTSFTLSRSEWHALALMNAFAVVAFLTITLAFLESDIKTVLAVKYLTSTIVSIFIARLIFKEAITTINIAAIVTAITGILVFAYPYESFLAVGVVYTVVAMCCFMAISSIMKKTTITPEVIMAVEFPCIAIVLMLVVLVTGAPTIVAFNALALGSVILFGILLVAVTYLLVYGYRNTNFNIANIILTAEIFFGIVLGYLLLNQTITALEFVGILVVFIAAVMPSVQALIRGQKSPPDPLPDQQNR